MNVTTLAAAAADGIAIGMVAQAFADGRRANRASRQAHQAATDLQARLDAAHAKVDAMLAKHRGQE